MFLDLDLQLTILCFLLFALLQVMASPPASLEYTPSYLSYHAQRRTWLRLCRSLRGKTLRQLTDMADEVLAHLADGQAFNFIFLPALRRAMECYFEKVGSTLQTVSEADYRRDSLLPILEEALHETETRVVDTRDHLAEIVLQTTHDDASFAAPRSASALATDVEVARRLSAWDRDMERRLRRRLHEAREEVSFIFRAVRHYEGADTATDALLASLETIQGALEDMFPEHCP
ncbi:hypothetical protein LIER_32091 [Lithospermum erythrorhizon]|uniref:Uncharacterized protein n=1 Tax=Lithospermum erythrorhizon TaxID=34254 RepID=A0AAV3RSX7_LITER